MNRTMKTIVSLVGIIALMAILSVVVYYAGGALAKSFLGTGGMTHSEWLSRHYFSIVEATGLLSGSILLLWFLLARWVLKVNAAIGAGRRTVWAALLVVETIICLASQYAYASLHRGLPTSIIISLLFLVLFAGVGYWLGSIFATPDVYKYTPLGSMAIRAPKRSGLH